jgi:hypothetical protein
VQKTTTRVGLCALLAMASAACSAAPGGAGGVDGLAAAIPSYPHREVCPAAPGQLRCHAHVRTDDAGNVVQDTAPQGLSPADLRSAYALPSSGGAGKTIAIVDAYDDPSAESDLAQYRAQFGLPPCTTANGCFRKVNEQGQASPLPAANAGWSSEIALDLDMASAVCPSCHILLVEATQPWTTDLGAAVNTAVALGASVVSNSYGGSEDSSITQADALFFHHPGVLITASSGDSGYGVQYPASSAYVTAVGGTSLVRSGSGRGWTETAWSGAGSGCSGFIAKPAWQHDTGCARRMEADVAAVADPNTGVAVYDQGAWKVFGGTSVASPVVASIYALTGNSGADGSYSYAHAASFYDTTSGSNGTCSPSYECTAGAGYDGPTGNGTPNGADMAGVTDGGGGGSSSGGSSGSGSGSGSSSGSGSGSSSGGTGGGGNLIVNGGFENGLAGWTVNPGPVATESTHVHSGSSAALVGSATPFQGYGLVQQGVAVPATGTTTLTFWEYLVCEGSPTREWQQAKIVDVLDRPLYTVFRVCANSTGWTQQTVDLTHWKGQIVYVQFGARDDGHPGDPVWWYLDDVVATNH